MQSYLTPTACNESEVSTEPYWWERLVSDEPKLSVDMQCDVVPSSPPIQPPEPILFEDDYFRPPISNRSPIPNQIPQPNEIPESGHLHQNPNPPSEIAAPNAAPVLISPANPLRGTLNDAVLSFQSLSMSPSLFPSRSHDIVSAQSRRDSVLTKNRTEILPDPTELFNGGDESSEIYHSDEEPEWPDDSASEDYDERRSPAQIFHTRFREPERFTRREITCVLNHLQRGWEHCQAKPPEESRMSFLLLLFFCS